MMIEAVILKHLKKGMKQPVYMEEPEKAPARFVIFEKTSGTKKNGLSSSTFAFQSYAESLYEAAALNESVKAEVEGLVDTNEVASVRLNRDYNFTDTTKKRYRYQAVFDINHY